MSNDFQIYTVFDAPTTYLPAGWFWRCELNNSGYLLSPYGRPMFSYNQEYADEICYYDTENNCERKFHGSFADFYSFVEQKTFNWLSKDKMIEFLEITPDQANKIMNHELEPWYYLLQNRFFYKQDNQYMGIGNSYGFIWTEKFVNLEDCIAWIRNGRKFQYVPELSVPKTDCVNYCGSIHYNDTYETNFYKSIDDFEKTLIESIDTYGIFCINFNGLNAEAKKIVEMVVDDCFYLIDD